MSSDELRRLEKEFGLIDTPKDKVKKYVPYVVSAICFIFIISSFIASMENPKILGFATFDGGDENFGVEEVYIAPRGTSVPVDYYEPQPDCIYGMQCISLVAPGTCCQPYVGYGVTCIGQPYPNQPDPNTTSYYPKQKIGSTGFTRDPANIFDGHQMHACCASDDECEILHNATIAGAITIPGGYLALYPAIAVRDLNGTYHLVWQQLDVEKNVEFPDTFELQNWEVYYSQSSNASDGLIWTQPVMISEKGVLYDENNTDFNKSDIFPDVSVGRDGTVWAVWQSNRYKRNAGIHDWHIYKSKCTSNCDQFSSWSFPEMYDEELADSLAPSEGFDDINPSIDVDWNNEPHVTWQTNRNSTLDLPGTFDYTDFNKINKQNMSDWDWDIQYINEQIPLHPTNNVSKRVETRAPYSDEFPEIVSARRENGEVDLHIVWHGQNNTYKIFYENEYNIYITGLDSLSWSNPAVKINDSPAEYDDMFPHPDANLTYDGTISVVWQSDRDDGNFLLNTYPFYSDPAPGLAEYGRVNVADSNWTIYQSNSFDFGSIWYTRNLSTTDTSRMHPTIAVDELGMFHVSYQKLWDIPSLDWEIMYLITGPTNNQTGEFSISPSAHVDSYTTLDSGMKEYDNIFPRNKHFGWHSNSTIRWEVYYEDNISSMDLSSIVNLTISDETDSYTQYDYSQIYFYGNYTNRLLGEPIVNEDTQCQFEENSVGWSSLEDTTYNQTTEIYEYNKSFTTTATFDFNVTCDSDFGISEETDTFTVTSRGTITFDDFDGDGTTDFNTIEDPDQVNGATLENDYGIIIWDGPVNTVNQDFNSNVQIGQGFVNVDSSSLHISFNSSATITLYGVTGLVYPVILMDGIPCSPSVCRIISYSGGNLTFNVTHFTNYTAIEGTQLAVWDTTDSITRYEYHQINFYANFSNITNTQPIQGTGITCEISSEYSGWSTPVSMTYNATSKFYEYSRAFITPDDYLFNVTCDGTSKGFAVVNITDYFNVTHDSIEPNTESVDIFSTNQNRSDGDIACQVNFTDNARETMYAHYTWYRNGTYYDSGTDYDVDNNTLEQISTMGSNKINRYETWTCEVFADDWVNNETDKNNATVVIRNALPQTTMSVSSSGFYFAPLDADIECWVSGYDKDGDSMTAYYQWYNESVAVAGFNGSVLLSGDTLVSTLNGSLTYYDEEWACEVILFDGLENNTAVNDSIEVQPKKNIYFAEELAPDVSEFEPVLPDGLTTNFSINLIPDIESYSNAILKNSYGKIEFTEPVDFTKLNLSKHIDISLNNVSINITALPELNVSSNIELFNLTLVYPEVQQNGNACSSCSAMSYVSGLLYFEIDKFSTTPVTELYGVELAPDVSVFNLATDFRWRSSLDIANASDVFLKNTTGSRIDFLVPINATQLNLSEAVILKFRNATIDTSNTTIFERLNKPAEILFYNESLIYPLIMKNNLRCRDSCTYLSRTSYAFLINVTGFNLTSQTSYSLQEGAPTINTFNGSLTTDFTRPASREFDFDIEYMENVVLEKENLGKIEFNEIINISAGFLDWDSYVELVNNGPSGKYVSINTTMLPNLNNSADITLYDLSLVYPAIWYMNSTGGMEICPADICEIVSYPTSPENCKTNASCELVFNVTHFSTYWAMENDTSPRFVQPLNDRVWYENRNNTITNLEGYLFDPDNTTLLYSVSVDCSNITASIDSNTDVLFVPDTDWTGSCAATFNISDGENEAIKNITLNVIANIPPQFINGPISQQIWQEDNNKTINLSYYFWDPDNDTLVYGYQFLSTEDITVDINQPEGIATLIPDANWHGQNFIRFYGEDEKARTYSAPYSTLTVVSVNDVPALDLNIPDNTKSYITIDEDTIHSIYLPNHFTDVEDNDVNLVYYLASNSTNFNVSFNSTAYVTFIPNLNWNGYESFIIFARDSHGAIGQSNEFVIYVTAQADEVHLVNTSNNTAYFEWDEDTNYSFDISPWFEDPDNDSIYYYEQAITSQITVNLDPFNGPGKFIPAPNFVGSEIINFTATDGAASVTVYATCNVTNVDDDLPVFDGPIFDQTWNEDNNHTINLSYYFSDPDLTPLVYTVILSPTHITITINNATGVATLEPDADWDGVEYVIFRATDTGNNTNDSNNVLLNVLPQGDVPRLDSSIPNQNWAKNTNRTINLSNYFTDPEDDPLSFTSTIPSDITVYIENTSGIVVFEPDTNFVGANTINFTAYDTEGNNVTSNEITLTIVEGPSYLTNTYVDGTLYNGNNYTSLTGIVISNLTDSNITSSNLYNCLVNDSTIINSNGTNCTVNNSIVRKSEFDGTLCNIDSWVITSGYITFNGTTYDATGSGIENLTDIINYVPIAGFTGPSSAKPNTAVIFTDTTIDYNIPSTSPGVPGEGLLNDNLTYFWDFGDGANSTTSNGTHTYTSQATYIVTLTVTDDFGEVDSYSSSIQIKTTPSGGGGSSGGSGGGIVSCDEKWNCTDWDKCTPYSIAYRTCVDTNGCGTFYYKPADTQVCDYTPTCSDYVINQDESDADCGGTICSPCVDGRLCLSDADCINDCVNTLCTTVIQPVEERPVLPPPLPPIEEIREGLLTKEVLGLSLWVYLLAIVAAGLLITGGLFVGKQKAKKIGEMPTYSYMDSLKAAIKRDIVRGVPEGSIKGALLEIGWPRYLVDQAIKEINKAMIKEPVQNDITKGYDELKLKKALVGKGWPVGTVDEVIDDVNISILRNTMKSNIDKGFTASKVAKGMVNKGWPKESVNKIADEFNTAK